MKIYCRYFTYNRENHRRRDPYQDGQAGLVWIGLDGLDVSRTVEKISAFGHWCVGENSDFRVDIRYRPGKINIDADTLCRLPLDIEKYVFEWTETFSDEAVWATWDGIHLAKQKDVAWVTTLNTTALDSHQSPHVNLRNISHSDLVKAQREESAISQVIKLKELRPEHTKPTPAN